MYPVPVMNLSFTKMHGLGNDFVVLNAMQGSIDLSKEQLRFLSDRRMGVGCDQILLIEPPISGNADIRYRVFNADGGEVEHCGNGIRCVGIYLRDKGLMDAQAIRVETVNGQATIHFESDSLIRVDMGVPEFEPGKIPLATSQHSIEHKLALSEGTIDVLTVSMGNPHAVVTVEDLSNIPIETMGPEIQAHELFPESVNVGFMQVLNREQIRLRVFERGVGETLACGTGACAAVAAGIKTGRLEHQVEVELRGGKLKIEWHANSEILWMTGPATTVYEGQITI